MSCMHNRVDVQGGRARCLDCRSVFEQATESSGPRQFETYPEFEDEDVTSDEEMEPAYEPEDPADAVELSCEVPEHLSSESPSTWDMTKEEVHASYFEHEKKYRVFKKESKYVKYRWIIIDWMCEVGEESSFSTLTIHMAARHLDRVLSEVTVVKNKMQLVAMVCMIVAAKFQEMEDIVPSVQAINEISNNAYTPKLINQMELMVLRHLNWNLSVITPIHFLKYYLEEGFVFERDLGGNDEEFAHKARRYARKYADFFAELTLQEHQFQQYLPSVLAGAIIACSRRAIKFEHVWCEELEHMCKYSLEEIKPAYLHIYGHYEKTFPSSGSQMNESPRDASTAHKARTKEQETAPSISDQALRAACAM